MGTTNETPKYKFSEGERVLCFHGPLIYEAKALKSTITKEKQIKYYIHYAGWNKNWDEWVPENRVLKFNEGNVQKQRDVFKQHAIQQSKARAKAKAKKNDAANLTKDGGTSSGGSESRASTPSKEMSTLSAPATAPTTGRGNRSKQNATTPKDTEVSAADKTTTTTTATSASATTANTTTTSAAATSTSTATTTTSTTPIPSATPTTKRQDDTKEDKQQQDDIISEPPKKKRGGSVSNASEKSYVSTASSTPTIAPPTPTPSITSSTRQESSVEGEELFLSKIEVRIRIPDELKQCLADDWDAIMRQNKMFGLPAKPTVQDIIEQYANFKKSSKTTNATKELSITDVCNGIIEYFDVLLGTQLLYKFERPQYNNMINKYPNLPPSKLYGSFHLLRLFVKLGSMLAFTALDEKTMQLLVGQIHDLIKYLAKNSATYFNMSSFVNVSQEYHRNTQ